MREMRFEFEKMRSLLRKRADDPAIIDLIERAPALIERSAYLGVVEFKGDGVSVVFAEAPWVIAPNEITDPSTLHVSAFHLYRQDQEAFCEYQGKLPGSV